MDTSNSIGDLRSGSFVALKANRWYAALAVGAAMLLPSVACAETVTNVQYETTFCQTLDSAMIAKETRGKAKTPADCVALPKARWRGIVLVDGDFELLAVTLDNSTEYVKGWASSDQLYRVYVTK
jgi:hypothetical protein